MRRSARSATAIKRSIASLSAGQFQRVLFARMLLQDADLILLDEPFNAIDARTTAAIKGKMVANKDLSALSISVNTTGGIVTLSGSVNSTDDISKAMMLAMDRAVNTDVPAPATWCVT